MYAHTWRTRSYLWMTIYLQVLLHSWFFSHLWILTCGLSKKIWWITTRCEGSMLLFFSCRVMDHMMLVIVTVTLSPHCYSHWMLPWHRFCHYSDVQYMRKLSLWDYTILVGFQNCRQQAETAGHIDENGAMELKVHLVCSYVCLIGSILAENLMLGLVWNIYQSEPLTGLDVVSF